jgi:hypothetical protein
LRLLAFAVMLYVLFVCSKFKTPFLLDWLPRWATSLRLSDFQSA